jgi:DNA-binding response OmpR family regulator
MNKTIWVIDDDEGILDVICLILQQEKYNCITSRNPQELLKLLPDKKPSLILLDVLMSGIDGREISNNLKSKKNTKDIPIILMTADIHAEEKAIEAKADSFIQKPFDIDDLLSKIKTFAR